MGLREYGAGGRFAGRVVEGFDHAPEGVALYPCPDGEGYWIAADQAPQRTVFLVLDRRTLEPVGRFAGRLTANTDGVWLSNVPVPGFPAGALYAVHDDASVTAFDWRHVADALGLRADCASDGK
jgi:3-phytase